MTMWDADRAPVLIGTQTVAQYSADSAVTGSRHPVVLSRAAHPIDAHSTQVTRSWGKLSA